MDGALDMSFPQSRLSHPKYRPDIDGLRAVAVLAVVGFHAFPGWLQGGFVGVDIFFVISGYLISTILFESLDKGTFSFGEFYARRIRRIFPALLLVLVVSYVFGWLVLLADEFEQLGKHIAAGAGFVANLVLWSEAGYFDNSAETKPLLHLWSLGIEEQFYIVWPVLLWLAWKRHFNLLLVALLLALASLYLNVRGAREDAVATFFSPQTRFWELLCGSLLAWLTLYKRAFILAWVAKFDRRMALMVGQTQPGAGSGWIANLLSLAGLTILVYGFREIHKGLDFPGTWAMLPVLGAALIIASGPLAWVNRHVLSNQVAVWFGLISFPLYLWHWPLLSFTNVIEGVTPDRTVRGVMVLTSVMLAWLTYRLIERPLRLGKRNGYWVIGLVATMFVAGCVGYYTYRSKGLDFRAAEMAAGGNRFDAPYRESCQALMGNASRDDWCNAGRGGSGVPHVVLIGDSFANAFSPMLKAYAARADRAFSFVQFGRGQCPMLLDYGPKYCREIAQKAHDYIGSSSAVQMVVLSANWPAYSEGKHFVRDRHIADADVFRASFERTLRSYRQLGKAVAVFLAPPVGAAPKSCLSRSFKLGHSKSCGLAVEKARARDGNYREFFLPLLRAYDAAYFDPFVYFCGSRDCRTMHDEKILSIDGWHLSEYGGEYLAEQGHDELALIFRQVR